MPNGTYQNNCYKSEIINEIYTHLSSLKEFQSKLTDNIITFKNSSTLINGTDFIATIISSNNLEQKINLIWVFLLLI